MNEIRSFLKSGIRSVFLLLLCQCYNDAQQERALLVAAADRRYLAERETIFLVLIVNDEVVERLAFGWLLVRQRRDDLTTTQQYHTAFNSVQKLNVTYCWLRRTNVL